MEFTGLNSLISEGERRLVARVKQKIPQPHILLKWRRGHDNEREREGRGGMGLVSAEVMCGEGQAREE